MDFPFKIVRVKRKVQDDCTESILLSAKRRKHSDSNEDSNFLQETLNFAGTSDERVCRDVDGR